MELTNNIYNNNFKNNYETYFTKTKTEIVFRKSIHKEDAENSHIYSRNLPLDNIEKNQIIPPHYPYKSKLKEKEQKYIFPPKTEVLIKDKSLLSGNYPKKYLQQNFVNIDDESFLYNINVAKDEYNTFNTLTIVSNELFENHDSYKNNLKEQNTNIPNKFNKETKRKNIIKDMRNKDQKWCMGIPEEYSKMKETKKPKPLCNFYTNFYTL